ncbi:MAG TPA: hypothetical protein VEC14_12270 [Reyranellaceae bacterium]|nr:hypothetical protein [Reyranellaceae bacterium]
MALVTSAALPAAAQQPPLPKGEVHALGLVKQGYALTNVFPGFLTFQKGNSLYICVPAAGGMTNTATLAAKTVATAACAEVN